MGSPITFSGFNQIDFNVILNAVMTQERAPLTALQTTQTTNQAQITALDTLSTRVSKLRSAAADLSSADGLQATSGSVSDSAALRVETAAGGLPGTYDVVVQELARAQVTASSNTTADADTTLVATGGALTIGGIVVTVPPGGVTLQGLANLINDTDDIAVRAAVLAAAPNQYRLVLTSASTGEDGAFTITHALTGGSGVAFTDTDNDGISGDDAADNAVAATNARALVNNLQVESSSNNLEDVIPGASLTLLRKDAAETHQVTIATDYTAVETKVKAFITAYNDLMQFMSDQSALAQKGDAKNIARDPILRSLKTALRGAITAEHDLAVSSLGAAGIEFEGVSELALSPTRFREAMDASAGAVVDLFTAAFGAIETALEDYEASDGILAAARAQRTDYSKTLRDRIIDLEERLAARRAALQKEYIAADLAMSRINGQMGALSSLGSHYRLF